MAFAFSASPSGIDSSTSPPCPDSSSFGCTPNDDSVPVPLGTGDGDASRCDGIGVSAPAGTPLLPRRPSLASSSASSKSSGSSIMLDASLSSRSGRTLRSGAGDALTCCTSSATSFLSRSTSAARSVRSTASTKVVWSPVAQISSPAEAAGMPLVSGPLARMCSGVGVLVIEYDRRAFTNHLISSCAMPRAHGVSWRCGDCPSGSPGSLVFQLPVVEAVALSQPLEHPHPTHHHGHDSMKRERMFRTSKRLTQ